MGAGEVRARQDVGGDRKSACGLPKRREMRVLQIIVPFYSALFSLSTNQKKEEKGKSKGYHIIIVNISKSQ